MAQTLRIDVRHRLSTLTNGPSRSTAIFSSPQPSVQGRRPTVTSTRSPFAFCGFPSASVNSTVVVLPRVFAAVAFAPRCTGTLCLRSHIEIGRRSSAS